MWMPSVRKKAYDHWWSEPKIISLRSSIIRREGSSYWWWYVSCMISQTKKRDQKWKWGNCSYWSYPSWWWWLGTIHTPGIMIKNEREGRHGEKKEKKPHASKTRRRRRVPLIVYPIPATLSQRGLLSDWWQVINIYWPEKLATHVTSQKDHIMMLLSCRDVSCCWGDESFFRFADDSQKFVRRCLSQMPKEERTTKEYEKKIPEHQKKRRREQEQC